MAIVHDFDQASAACRNFHGYIRCACIQGILDQFLDNRCRALDNFTGGNFIGNDFGQDGDTLGHCGSPQSVRPNTSAILLHLFSADPNKKERAAPLFS